MRHLYEMQPPPASFAESLRLWRSKVAFTARLLWQLARRGLRRIGHRRRGAAAVPASLDFETVIEALQSGQTDALDAALIGATAPDGQPWIFHAIDLGSVASVQWFCQRDGLAQTDRGGRSLMQAAIERSLSVDEFDDCPEDTLPMIAALAAQGVDVNGADAMGLRPLHIAASLGAVAAARLLIDLGAKAGLSDGLGLTATDYALRLRHAELVALLRADADG